MNSALPPRTATTAIAIARIDGPRRTPDEGTGAGWIATGDWRYEFAGAAGAPGSAAPVPDDVDGWGAGSLGSIEGTDSPLAG
jgi:hypothetical protein